MSGFKSFGDRTVTVNFSRGFTCVVGPNGAGKSNIIDALCFALGRLSKKTMRAKNLEDLIFAGSTGKNPSTRAAVTITFDNSEGIFPGGTETFEITRIIKKGGLGKYKMNGKTATRQQILNSLAAGNVDPDGSNQFVLQGKIVELTHMNTEERRKFIEELIGLQKYDEMKDATYKELEKAERDLGQFEAIFKEVSSQLKKVEKEKNDALAWKALDEKINFYNAQLIALKISKLQDEEKELEKRIEETSKLIEEFEEKITSEENLLKQEIIVMENIQGMISDKEGERELINESLTDLKTKMSSIQTELNISNQSIDKLIREKEQLEKQQMKLEEGQTYDLLIENTKDQIANCEIQIENAKNEIENCQQHQAEIELKISGQEEEKAKLNSEISTKKQKISSYQTQIKILQENISKNEEKRIKLTDELNKLKGESEDVEGAIKQTIEEEQAIRNQIEDFKQEITEENDRQKELEREITNIQEDKNRLNTNHTDIQATLTSLSTEIKLQNENIENFKKKKNLLEARISEISKGEDAESTTKALIRQKSEVSAKLQDLKVSSKENESTYRNNEKELEVLKLKQNSINSEINTFQSKNDNFQVESNIFKKELTGLHRDKQALELNLKNVKNKIEKINDDLKNLKIKGENIQRRLTELIEEKENTIKKINKSEEEYEKNKEDIKAILQILNMLTQNIEISVDSIKGNIQQSNAEVIGLAGEDLRKFVLDVVDIMKTMEGVSCDKENIDEMSIMINSIRQTLDMFIENVDESIEQLFYKVRESVDIAVQDSTSNFDTFVQDLMEILQNIYLSLKTLTISKSQDLYKQLEEISENISSQEKELNVVEREISEIQLTKSHDQDNVKANELRLKNTNERINELTEKIDNIEKDIVAKINIIDSKKNEIDEINKEIKIKTDSKNSYWDNLSNTQREIEENQKIFDELQEKLQDLQGIQTLYENIAEIETNIGNLERSIEENKNNLVNTETKIEKIENQKQKLQKDIDKLKIEKDRFWERTEELNKNIDFQNEKLEKILDRKRALENIKRNIETIEEIKVENTEASKKIEQSKTSINDLNSEIEKVQLDVDKVQSEINSFKNEKKDELKKQKAVQKELNQLNKELQKFQGNLNELLKNKEREQLIFSLIEERTKTENKIKNLETQITGMEDSITIENERKEEKQKEIDELIEKKDESWNKQKQIQKKVSDLKTNHSMEKSKLNNFESKKIICVDQIETFYERSKEYGTLPTVTEDLTESALQNQIVDANNKKKALEPVNLKAIEQYDVTKERFDEIDMRRQTIQRERKAILDAIEKIELEKTKTFMKSYHEINRAFSNIFQKLSPGGSAKMILDRPDSPFDGGITINARPHGKHVSSLEILSGGEKTLVALSFIFSVQEFYPAPFYIMDEIDAALDVSNVHRVSMAIKEFSNQAQFIVISHREENIVNADRIYGVSMQQSGITDIFSVDLQSEAKKLLELGDAT